MLFVGLTGGIGAGKSTVARMLADRGAVVFDADQLARQAVAKATPGFAKVVEEFGPGVVGPDGELDRSRLAEVVFADEHRRRKLEEITHPEVFRLLQEGLDRYRDTDAVVVFDVPLLVESGAHGLAEVVVVVIAPVDVQIERVMRDRGMSAQEAQRRIDAQVSNEERAAAADFVIANDGSLEELEQQVARVWEELRARGG